MPPELRLGSAQGARAIGSGMIRFEWPMIASWFGAARHAMSWFGMANDQMVALKVDTLDDAPDFTTKPLTGDSLFKHLATVLGFKHRVSVDPL